MADNVAVTAGSGTTIAADEVVDGTLGTVKVQYVKLMDGTLDGSTKATVGANGLKVDPSGVTSPVSLASVPSHAVTNAGTFAVQVTSAPTTAVTGTFWQTTQPVSGTFWQATQPVSLATNTPVIAAGTNVIGKVGINDGTSALTLMAASTGAPAATVVAVPVTIRDVNPNISDGTAQTTTGHAGAPVVGIDPYSQYETVAASQTSQVMGATGAQYDYLAGVLIIPATSAAGAVSIADGNGSAISVFAGGGTTALADLKPFIVPLGIHALAGTSPGWKITTGTNVSAIGIGKFT